MNPTELENLASEYREWLNTKAVTERKQDIVEEKKKISELIGELLTLDKRSSEFTDHVWSDLLPHQSKPTKKQSIWGTFTDVKAFFRNKYGYNDKDLNLMADMIFTLSVKSKMEPKKIKDWIDEFTANKSYSKGFQCGLITPILFCVNGTFPIINTRVVEMYNKFSDEQGWNDKISNQLADYPDSISKCKKLVDILRLKDYEDFDLFCVWQSSRKNHWLCSVSAENFEIIKKRMIWASKYKNMRNKIKPGDILIFYVVKSNEFQGIFRLKGKWYDATSPVWNDESNSVRYKSQICLEPIISSSVNVNDIAKKLKMFSNASNARAASLVLRGGHGNPSNSGKPIDPHDYQTIYDAMKGPETYSNAKLNLPVGKLSEAKATIRDQLLISEGIIEQVIFSLYSGKHVILTGPVGTGKTELAQLIPKVVWNYYPYVVTATSEWTTQDVIGGISPKVKKGNIKYEVQKGCVSHTVSKNWSDGTGQAGERHKFKKYGIEYDGVWLVIDEFNRAGIDRAFGPLFTSLYYNILKIPTIESGEIFEEIKIPEDYRIIGTLNTFDKHFLFKLSDALKRRFSFIEILPPNYNEAEEEIRIATEKSLEGYDDIRTALEIHAFDNLDKNGDVYFILKSLHNILTFVRLSKNLGTAVLVSMFRFAIIYYSRTKKRNECIDCAIMTQLIPHLETLQYWQIDSIMNFVDGRIHGMFAKIDVKDSPDVERYADELKNLIKYMGNMSKKESKKWLEMFRSGKMFKKPNADLEPWGNQDRPRLLATSEALKSLAKERGYFEESNGLD